MVSSLLQIDPTLDTLNLSTTSGVVLASMFIVEALKKVLKNVTWFNNIPVFVYTMAIAALLATFANKVLHNDNGQPFLAGANIWLAIWRSIVAAGAASGFYTWLRNPEGPRTASIIGDCDIQQSAPTTEEKK